jgi:hypothetical protein
MTLTSTRQFEEFYCTFKANSHHKALQAWDLADSLQRDLVDPLKSLKMHQDAEAEDIHSQGLQLVQSLK